MSENIRSVVCPSLFNAVFLTSKISGVNELAKKWPWHILKQLLSQHLESDTEDPDFVRFQVLTAVNMKMIAFRVVSLK
jgi:hypothetical protein